MGCVVVAAAAVAVVVVRKDFVVVAAVVRKDCVEAALAAPAAGCTYFQDPRKLQRRRGSEHMHAHAQNRS